MTPSLPFSRVLMVHPRHYDIKYAINPYMRDSSGQLLKVNKAVALEQWTALKRVYESLGFEVCVLEAREDLPDMVFAANQVLPFLDLKTGKKSVLLGEMKSDFRKPEVQIFEKFFREEGYQIHKLGAQGISMEGNGDLLLHPSQPLFFAGYGHRTDRAAIDEIGDRFGYEIFPMHLLSEDFYHLDTCLAILDANTVLIQPEAFDNDVVEKLQRIFKNTIAVDRATNVRDFICNSHSPNGVDVITNHMDAALKQQLSAFGFQIHETPTSEFIKAGGSVFCLKMMIF